MLADAFFSRKGALVSVKSCAFFVLVQAVTTLTISILAVANKGVFGRTGSLPLCLYAFAAQQSLALQIDGQVGFALAT